MIELKEIENIIRNKSKTISEDFLRISQDGFRESFSFEIDEKKLDSKYSSIVNVTSEGDFSAFFQEIMKFDEFPALYFFEINESIEKDEIITNIKTVNLEKNLNIPAQNNTLKNEGVLYVGKVKSRAWGRLIQHLGYHKNAKSHGLQLDHWAKNIKSELKLKYTVIFFEKDIVDDIDVLEKSLAKSLKPIIGKH
jgi:hypothetical protein